MVKTSLPLPKPTSAFISEISQFWDKTSLAWQTIWGPHIHHGYYETEKNISPIEAQEKLIDNLASILKIKEQDHILDIGCGMGGSSRYLAQRFNSSVTGITLSQTQVNIADSETPADLSSKVSYRVEDAHHLSFSDNEFDIVWSLESCEQFYDKTRFIKEALRVLKPGGKLMIATWCSDKEQYETSQAKTYLKLCRSFLTPYMPTISYYSEILSECSNLIYVDDWSEFVKQTWDFAIEHLKTLSWLKLLKMGGLMGINFVRDLKLIRNAFQTGQLRYGVLIAQK